MATKKTKLIIYLRKLGFNVEYQPDKIICTDKGNSLIMFKRGMLTDKEYERIGTALISSGYAVDDYDQYFLTKKPKKELPSDEDIEAWALDNFMPSEALIVCRVIWDYKEGNIPVGYAEIRKSFDKK